MFILWLKRCIKAFLDTDYYFVEDQILPQELN